MIGFLKRKKEESLIEVRAHLFLSGKIQGVFFRDSMKKKAEKLGVSGWVKNLKDGRVEAVFEGKKDKVESMVKWSNKGPILAKVEDLEADWEEPKGNFKEFDIKYEI